MHRRIRQHNHCQDRGRPFLGLCLRGGVRLVQTCVAVVAVGVALVVCLAMVASVRPLPVGAALTKVIESRLESHLAQRSLAATVGSLDVSFRTGLVPVIAASDIELRRIGEAVPLMSLSQAEIVLHRASAAVGLLAPKALRLNGMQITAVSRGDELALDLGGATVIPAVSNPGELIAELSQLFDRPALAQIEEIGLSGIDLRAEDRTNGWTWRSRSGDLRVSRSQAALRVAVSLGGLGEASAPGSLSLRLSADLSRNTGTLAIAGRGVNPAQILPREGARISAAQWLVDAPVSLDLSADILPNGDLGPLQGGFAVGAGQMPLPGGRMVQIDTASAALQVSEGQDHARLSDLRLRSDLLALDGAAQLFLSETPLGVLRAATLQLALSDLWLAPGLGFDRDVAADRLDALLEFDRPTGRVTLGPSYLALADEVIELAGYVIPPATEDPPAAPDDTAVVQQISLSATPAAAPSRTMLPDGWQAGLDLATASLSAQTALGFWPPKVEPKTRAWVLQNVFSGQLSKARLSMRLPPVGKAETGISFHFAEASAWAEPRLPAFEDGRGFFSLQNRRLAVQIEQGSLPLPSGDRIALTDGLLIKSDVKQKDAPLEISGHGSASVAQVLRLLELPLFRSGDDTMPLQPDEAEGRVSLDLALSVPMGPNRKSKRASFDAQGVLSDLATDALLPGRVLASPGLTIDLSQDRVALAGPVTLDGMAADAVWEKPLGPGSAAAGSSVSISAPLTQALAASFGVPLRPSEMRGAGQMSAKVALLPGQPPALDLSADLTGAAFSVPGVGWSKSAGRAASLRLAGRLGAAPAFDTLRLDAPGLLATGSLRIGAGSGLETLDLSRLRIGTWIDAPLSLRPGAGNRVSVALSGGQVDLRGLPSSGGGGGDNPLSTAELSGTRVTVDQSLALTGVSGTLDLQNGGTGVLRGRVNGKSRVTVRLSKVDTGTRIRINADDAGAAARDAGLFAQGTGGSLRLELTPTGQAKQYYGDLRIRDITITDAPVATSLLSAISVVGLAEQIGTGGLHFGQVDAAFLLTPDAVVVSESSATGPSLGLSLDGKLNLKAKTMDMQGVLSPFFFVNRMGSGLTRRGEGLLGVTFRLSGPFKTPEVRANPLSIFTPGMFRELFRRDPPDIHQGTGSK